ncbi:uncharacterized protein GLRG_10120 [Colletotrichum graminicola M1.001]|uniref:Uncharacterized protein n=1 Tax=Colletotrichum graminicola (strain M1.001 / M2 / FGSC 10212) TaxID=645133 RepID=E3QVT8_COLGM|nr:uncharacterized protein GLRG_10120 [Colletotrichum graminicola M1.001]EFQ34976.1 hypothetical protein GLRG_10120 [Colletotrichum graminicola M1.001]
MHNTKQKSGSSHKTSSRSCRSSKHGSSGSVSPSSSNQQQQVPRTIIAQYVESDRHLPSTQNWQQHSNNVGSRDSTTGSANDRYSGHNDDYRSYDVQRSYQVRREHAINLPGPAPPPRQRATPEEQLRAYDSRFGGYHSTIMAPTQYSYPQDLDLDSSEMPNNNPRRDF